MSAGLTPLQLARMGITAALPQAGSSPEAERQLLEDRYRQLVALRDSLPHISGTRSPNPRQHLASLACILGTLRRRVVKRKVTPPFGATCKLVTA